MLSHIPGRKEEFARSNKKDKRSGLQSLFAPSEALNLYFTRQKDEAQILCSEVWPATEKCQCVCDSFKDESNNSCNRKTTGFPDQGCVFLCGCAGPTDSPAPAALSVKAAQTHSQAQCRCAQVTEKKPKRVLKRVQT